MDDIVFVDSPPKIDNLGKVFKNIIKKVYALVKDKNLNLALDYISDNFIFFADYPDYLNKLIDYRYYILFRTRNFDYIINDLKDFKEDNSLYSWVMLSRYMNGKMDFKEIINYSKNHHFSTYFYYFSCFEAIKLNYLAWVNDNCKYIDDMRLKLVIKAILSVKENNYEKGISIFKKIEKQYNLLPSEDFFYIKAFIHTKRYYSALKRINRLLPTNQYIFLEYGFLLSIILNDIPSAKRHYTDMTNYKSDKELLLYLSILKRKEGNKKEALQIINQSVTNISFIEKSILKNDFDPDLYNKIENEPYLLKTIYKNDLDNLSKIFFKDSFKELTLYKNQRISLVFLTIMLYIIIITDYIQFWQPSALLSFISIHFIIILRYFISRNFFLFIILITVLFFGVY
ncbi:MAG TPA: hypothetical protein PK771_04040 [Spirochaetota bacterium]|nr:hypothetical protein [Spirochaetota bacterium]